MGRRGQASVFEGIPGLGPSLAKRITGAYGSEEAFEAACHDLDLARLLDLEGLSERRALQIVQEVRSGSVPNLHATDRAREVRRDLEDLLVGYANTARGKLFLRLLPTLRDAAAIEASARRVMEARTRAEGLDRPAVTKQLQRLAGLRDPPRVATPRRLLVVDDPDAEMDARARGLDRWARVVVAADVHEHLDPDVLVLDATSDGLDAAGADAPIVRARLTDPSWKLAPEMSTEFVRSNRGCLDAIRALACLVGETSRAAAALEAMDAGKATEPADLRPASAEALAAAQAELERRLSTLSVTGLQVLEFLSKGSSKVLAEARDAAVEVGRERLRRLTGLRIDPFEAGLPLRLDDELLAETSRRARSRMLEDTFRAQQEAARRIEALRSDLPAELERWVAFDVDFALGSFASDFNLVPAATGPTLRFDGATNLRLRRAGAVQPIAYEVGRDASVTVLTGANSGGKTSVLELIAQLVTLHHWGLPVPAEHAEIPILEELHCVAPVRGGDAGAFEGFLRDLFPPLVRPGRKLLLLDEVENVTELEAAGRILGVFIDEVARSGSLAVVVTHLPSEVLAHARAKVRVDGIDAVGLDEKFNLIVDRQPKLNHQARSTPELILRRVHSRSEGEARELFARILRLWEAKPASAARR